jgi:succinyl-diaminopimelate desuccinylase
MTELHATGPAGTHDPIVETLLWLCRVPSPTGEERALCDLVEQRVSLAPLAAPVRRVGDSIVVEVTRGTGGPKVALAGHLDVVRTEHDGPPRIEGDRLFGPGAADMKSGLALMLDLLERDRGDVAGVDLTLVFYAREEGPFADNELGPVLDAVPELSAVDLAVCLEPSDNKLSLGASGSLHAEIVFEGETAHSARPWQGKNAIHDAGGFLGELGALEPEEVVVDGLLYRAVTSITLAKGGRGRNVVPDRFELNLNHRFPPGRTLEEAQRHVERLVGGRARVTFTDLSPSALPFASHPLVVALRASGVTAVEPKQAWTDVARFAARGTPAVNFGPGDNAQAHQRNESTSIAGLLAGRRIVRDWLRRIGAG